MSAVVAGGGMALLTPELREVGAIVAGLGLLGLWPTRGTEVRAEGGRLTVLPVRRLPPWRFAGRAESLDGPLTLDASGAFRLRIDGCLVAEGADEVVDGALLLARRDGVRLTWTDDFAVLCRDTHLSRVTKVSGNT